MTPLTADPTRCEEHWRIASDSRLKLRFWDDECVLFHGAAGDTHRLPAIVGQLLQVLLESPASIDELSTRIDLHDDDVRSALQDLSRLAIVERVA